MKIYIDNDYKCHVSNDGSMTEVEAKIFDGMCDTYIEGYRYVPAGHTWTQEDGTVCYGEMVTPHKPYNELDAVQRVYERTMYLASLEKESSYTEAYNAGVQEA